MTTLRSAHSTRATLPIAQATRRRNPAYVSTRDGGDAIVGGAEPRRVGGDQPEGRHADDGRERPAGRGTA